MVVVVPTPLLLKVPALVKRPAMPPKLLLLMSASSVTLNVPLFWNSEPGLAPPLELMFRIAAAEIGHAVVDQGAGRVAAVTQGLVARRAAHRQRGRVVDRGGAGTGERAAVQLKAPVMFCEPVPPSVPLERLSVVSVAVGRVEVGRAAADRRDAGHRVGAIEVDHASVNGLRRRRRWSSWRRSS